MSRLKFMFVFLLGSLLSHSVCGAADWSRFRGPNGTGQASHAGPLPTHWDDGNSVIWKQPVPRGSSSPIVRQEKLFVTGFTGYAQGKTEPGNKQDLRLHVLAYDFETGQSLWDYELPASENEQSATKRVEDHGYASSTPCSDGVYVFASFGPTGVVALDMDGNLVWQRSVGIGTAGFGAASSPIEFEDLVFVNASIESDTLFAFEKATGEIAWQLAGIERAWTTPALVRLPGGKTELVIHFKNEIRGLDPRTGDVLWQAAGIPDYIVPVPVVDGSVIYFSGGRQNQTLAVRAGGRGDVSDSHILWQVNKGANVTTPVFYEGYLYWSHDKAFAQAMDASTGELAYQERCPSRDRVYASAVCGDQKLYMTQRDGTTLVLKAQPKYTELASNRLGNGREKFNATPAIHQGSLIFRSTEFLYRIGQKRQ